MEINRLHYPGNVQLQTNKNYSLAIGFFDGLHKGHQAVIREAIERAETLNVESAVMTFDPHPSHIIGNRENKVQYLTSFEEKCRLLESMGVQHLFVVTFDHTLASLSPEKFIDVFIKGLGAKHVTAGFDFRFGSRGAGTMELIAKLANGEYGATVVGKVADSDEEVSSTRIRKLVKNGQVEEATKLLGRPYKIQGVVVGGDKRGRQIGFPTANVRPGEDVVYPRNGVYAVRFYLEDQIYNGVCNIGVKPTFNKLDSQLPSIEVHLFDFDTEIYGATVEVDLIKEIRDEKKFDSIDGLTEQIAEDKKTAFNILTKE